MKARVGAARLACMNANVESRLPDLTGVPLGQFADEDRDAAARRALPELPPVKPPVIFSSSI
jgi:hypothetical protein